MADQHTPGKLVVCTLGYPHADVKSEGPDSYNVALTWGLRKVNKSPANNAKKQAEARANARRIVACWNYCIGLPTEELEASVARGDEWEPA